MRTPTLTRRTFLRGGAATTVLVAGGGVWIGSTQSQASAGRAPAYAPWTSWRTDRPTGPIGVVHAGVLAANPHNTQPWLFHIDGGRIDLLADTSRHLGAMDPFLREMHIGLGCAVENMLLAAAALGYAATPTLLPGDLTTVQPGSGPVHVATVSLEPGSPEPGALFAAIPSRHTDRGPYDTHRPVEAETLRALAALAGDTSDVRLFLLTEAPLRKTFSDRTVEATRQITGDAAMSHDSHAWFRHGRRELVEHRDGVTLDAVGLSPLIRTIAKILPPPSREQGDAMWVRATEEIHCATAAAFGLIAVRRLYDRELALKVGRVWQRIHLWGTAQGLAMQPLNQLMEVVDREKQLGQPGRTAPTLEEFTGDPSWLPTFAFRVGFPVRAALASPRRAVQDVLA